MPVFSIIASAYRTQWWDEFTSSLIDNDVSYEIIFVGHRKPDKSYPNLKYIYSEAKPAECYDIARKEATGEWLHWTADDAVYTPKLLDLLYSRIKDFPYKTIVSMQTKENGHFVAMHTQRLISCLNGDTPIMCPLGFIRRQYLEELGGFDARFNYGQYENDVAMRVYKDGGSVYVYTIGDAWIELDHKRKHENETRLLNWYHHDRDILLSLWMENGKIRDTRADKNIAKY